jgi:hypothetical protein
LAAVGPSCEAALAPLVPAAEVAELPVAFEGDCVAGWFVPDVALDVDCAIAGANAPSTAAAMTVRVRVMVFMDCLLVFGIDRVRHAPAKAGCGLLVLMEAVLMAPGWSGWTTL